MENENMEEKHPKKAQKLSYDIDHVVRNEGEGEEEDDVNG